MSGCLPPHGRTDANALPSELHDALCAAKTLLQYAIDHPLKSGSLTKGVSSPAPFYTLSVRLGKFVRSSIARPSVSFVPQTPLELFSAALRRFRAGKRWMRSTATPKHTQEYMFVHQLSRVTTTVTADPNDMSRHVSHMVVRKVKWIDVPLHLPPVEGTASGACLVVAARFLLESHLPVPEVHLPRSVPSSFLARCRILHEYEFSHRPEWSFQFRLVWARKTHNEADKAFGEAAPTYQSLVRCTNLTQMLQRYKFDSSAAAYSVLLKTMDMVVSKEFHEPLVMSTAAPVCFTIPPRSAASGAVRSVDRAIQAAQEDKDMQEETMSCHSDQSWVTHSKVMMYS